MCQAPEPRLLQAKKETSAVETGVGGQGTRGLSGEVTLKASPRC